MWSLITSGWRRYSEQCEMLAWARGRAEEYRLHFPGGSMSTLKRRSSIMRPRSSRWRGQVALCGRPVAARRLHLEQQSAVSEGVSMAKLSLLNCKSGMVQITGTAWTMLPDWGLGRVYTVVVVNCTFPRAVGSDGAGGRLALTASHGDHDPRPPERFTALTEAAGRHDASVFHPGTGYPYEHLYCGSPLYGTLSPHRVREWLAYHAWLLGPRSHFVLYDAGGVDAGVRRVLEPWVKQGRVTVHDVREQEAFDGYYYNQFLIVNDSLFRTRFLADWTFFFDMDEYLYVDPATTLRDVLRQHSGSTQLLFEQVRIGAAFCAHTNASREQQWAFEKQVYKVVTTGQQFQERKYGVQARSVYSAGVHQSDNFDGNSTGVEATQMRYYHYHGTLSNTGDICSDYSSVVDGTMTVWRDKEPLRYDASMADLAPFVREFEVQAIGPQPFPVE